MPARTLRRSRSVVIARTKHSPKSPMALYASNQRSAREPKLPTKPRGLFPVQWKRIARLLHGEEDDPGPVGSRGFGHDTAATPLSEVKGPVMASS